MQPGGFGRIVGWSALAVVLLWTYVPFVTLTMYAMHDNLFFSFPIDPTTKWFAQVFADERLLRVLGYTLTKSLIAAALGTLIAIPGAIAYARYRFAGVGLYKRLVLLPIFFPQLVLGVGILVFLHQLGILPSTTSMILGECVLLAPIAILVISIQLLAYSPEIEMAAGDLGANPWRVFRTITFPLIAPGVFAAFLFAFTISWSDFYIDLYADTRLTLSPWIYGHMKQGFSPEIPAVSVLAVAVSLLALTIAVPIIVSRMRALKA